MTIQQNKVHYKISSHHSFPVNSEGAKKSPSVKERSNRHRNGVPRVLLPKISISYWVGFVNSCHVTTKYLLLFGVIYFGRQTQNRRLILIQLTYDFFMRILSIFDLCLPCFKTTIKSHIKKRQNDNCKFAFFATNNCLQHVYF